MLALSYIVFKQNIYFTGCTHFFFKAMFATTKLFDVLHNIIFDSILF